jgi:hypothetical protein
MNKINQFFAAVMGKCLHRWRRIANPGYRCELCGATHYGYEPEDWSPSLNDPDFRKWWQGREPDEWRRYLEKTMYDVKIWPDILDAQLSIQNFYSYLTEHFEEWAFKDGTGRICKFAEAEKVLKEER